MDLVEKCKKIKLCRILSNKCEGCGEKKSDMEFWSLRGDHGKMDLTKDVEELADDLDWHMLLCEDCHKLGFSA